MATTKLEKELTEREIRYWKALEQRDTEAARELTDFPCLVTGAQGVARLDEQAFVKMMQSAQHTLRSADLHDIRVQQLTDDVAVVAYKVHEELIVEGEKLAFDAADSSTWIRRNGKWTCAAHSETIVGDPFGRDRKPS